MLLSFIDTLRPNNISINGTTQWPNCDIDNPKALVFDVNATELCRPGKDNFRSDAISYWMDLLTTNNYPK
ncbi:carboxylesterase family protein [Penicillium argentinense]|uniref:Carboxylesterase family protein n=1 Tax=Penicillium argentinense TaxID=1131581 RepID=A0A9W9G1K9_9EURO|nr:carboxylesterase family protein [Penicillium argentinense]KAJ5110434.1 carboxylesterase family protein [Penicillium argentinense]